MIRLAYEWFALTAFGWLIAAYLGAAMLVEMRKTAKVRAELRSDPAAIWLNERSAWISKWVIDENPPLERIAEEFAKMCKDHAGMIALQQGDADLINLLIIDGEIRDPGDESGEGPDEDGSDSAE